MTANIDDLVDSIIDLDNDDLDLDSLDQEAKGSESENASEVEKKVLNWYCLTTRSGKEFEAKEELEALFAKPELSKYFGEVYIPIVTTYEVKGTKTKKVEKKKFPGYIFVECDLDYDIYTAIRKLSRISGFTNNRPGQKPIPLRKGEIERIRESVAKEKYHTNVQVGSKVKFSSGAFEGNNGEVISISTTENRAKVIVEFAGRETEVDVNLSQLKVID